MSVLSKSITVTTIANGRIVAKSYLSTFACGGNSYWSVSKADRSHGINGHWSAHSLRSCNNRRLMHNGNLHRQLFDNGLLQSKNDSPLATANSSVLTSREFKQLLRSLIVLRLCSIETFSRNGEALYKLGRRLIGGRLTDAIVERTFYRQFIAGSNEEQLKIAAKLLLEHKILTMVCPPMEDLSDCANNETRLAQRKHNTEKFLAFLDVSANLNKQSPDIQAAVMQVKLSGIFSVHNMNELSAAIRKGKIPLGHVIDEFAAVIDSTSTTNQNEAYGCSDACMSDLRNSLLAFGTVLKHAAHHKIPLLIDAELRAAHEAMYAIGHAASLLYSRNEPVIFNTYQCYLKDTLDFLAQTREHCQKRKVAFGAKLVRGAYMTTERLEAKRANVADLVWPSYAETSANYDRCVSTMLSWITEDAKLHSLFVASHNQTSVDHAIGEMQRLQIGADTQSVRFAQIYGMCDQLSYNIASKGFNVYKSVPFGHLQEWIPYMVRRAAENYTAFATSRNEVPQYVAEIVGRLRSLGRSGSRRQDTRN